MNGLVKFYSHPKLTSPVLIAVWPGVGNVALIVANYLRKKLPFRRLASIEPSAFFSPTGVMVRDNLVEAPQFPQSKFYYWKNKKGENDLVLFIGDDQPAVRSYELAKAVIDVGEKYQVSRYYTFAAAITRIHHTESSRVWAVATNQALINEMRSYDLVQGSNLQIAGLNGLLLGVAKERQRDAVCLLGEVPTYATRMPNPMAALAVLEALRMTLNIDIELSEIEKVAAESREKMKQIVAEAMGEYISNFTEPIWEQGEEGGEWEEDEE